jgi:hypothetical protein
MKIKNRDKLYLFAGLAILLLFFLKFAFEKGEVLGNVIAK